MLLYVAPFVCFLAKHSLGQVPSATPSPLPTPSITPGLPEEQICGYASYVQAIDFEIEEGLANRELQCRDTVDNLRKQ